MKDHTPVPRQKLKIWGKGFVDLPFFFHSAKIVSVYRNLKKKVKFNGARCPFSTFLRLQGDHYCAYAQKWCHFHIFPRAFKQTKKKIKALRPKMTKIASRGSCLKLADVNFPGQRVPWRTNTVARLFHQPVLACFGVVSVVSGHFYFSFQVSHHSTNLSKIEHTVLLETPKFTKCFATKGLPKLVVNLPKLSNGFPLLNFIHALHPTWTMCFFGKQNCSW